MNLFELFASLKLDTSEYEGGIDKAKKDAGSFSDALKNAGSKVSSAGDAITNVGKKVAVGSAAIGAFGVGAAKAAIGFEDAMAKVSTIADTSQMSMEKMSDAITALSNETGVAVGDIAENVYNAISAGQETADAVSFVGDAVKLATAGFAESGDALDVLTTIMNAYGMEADKVGMVSDMLINTQNKGKTTVAELSATMGKIIPTAKSYSVGLEQITAGYAKMTANGIGTAEATTYMNGMLNELGKSGTKVSEALKKETGKTFAELMESGMDLGQVLDIVKGAAEKSGKAMGDMWSSSEAGKAASVISDTTNKLGDFTALVEDMKYAGSDAASETSQAFEKMKTTSYGMQVSMNQLKNATIELGQSVLSVAGPAISKFAELVSQLTAWFNSLDDSQKEMIVKIGMIAAAAGPAIMIFGKLVSGIGSLISVIGFLASPVGLAIAAIAALIAIGVLLYKNWDTVKAKAIELKNYMVQVWENIKAAIAEKVSAMSSAVSEHVERWRTAFSNGLAEIRSRVDSIFSAISSKVTGVMESVKSTVSNAVAFLKNAFNFEWKLPHINLPHFSISGAFSLNPPSVPSFGIEWYRKAYESPVLLNGATIFGAAGGKLLGGGEGAGAEVVAGEEKLMSMIRNAVRDEKASSIVQNITINQATSTPDELARAIRLESRYGLMRGVSVG